MILTTHFQYTTLYYMKFVMHSHREPSDSHGIKVSEVSVSKAHATITYNRYRREYSVKDLGSVNGTFINREERLSEVGNIIYA